MNLLEQLRLDAGMTREALSEETGVKVRTIRALERGVRGRPLDATIIPLAKGLEIAPSVLMQALDPNSPAPEPETAA